MIRTLLLLAGLAALASSQEADAAASLVPTGIAGYSPYAVDLSGTGSGPFIAGSVMIDPGSGQPLASLVASDPANAPFKGAVAMTVGTTYAAQRSVAAICTAAGNVSMTFSDGSAFVVPAVVGFQSFPFAVTAVNTSGTTATCTYANLK